MKKLTALLLAVVMVFALAACGNSAAPAAAETTVLKVAFNQSATNPEAKTLYWISEQLEQATQGRYKLEVYPDAQLGDQAQTLEQVVMGTLDMALGANSLVETYCSDFAILGTPYV